MIEITKNFISHDKSESLIKIFDSIEPSRWVDRSVNNINRSISGEVGKYYSADVRYLSLEIQQELYKIAPTIPLMDIQEIVINKYDKGGFMPKHRDTEGYGTFCILALKDMSGTLRYYNEGINTDIIDKCGQLITCKKMSLIHELLPTPDKRYSIIFLYL